MNNAEQLEKWTASLKERDRFPDLKDGGGGGTSGGMEARIAKLEAGVSHLETDVSEVKSDVKALIKDVASLKGEVSRLPGYPGLLMMAGVIVAAITAVDKLLP